MPHLILPDRRTAPPTILDNGPRREVRSIRSEVRAVPGAPKGTLGAVILRYGVIDDYGTLFEPGCFTDGLSQRMPRLCNNHDWDDVLGIATEWEDTKSDLRMTFRFTPGFETIPDLYRAYLELVGGTIDEFSVGFERQSDRMDDDPIGVGVPGVWITKALLYEASKVLAGAVAGTALLSIRSKPHLKVEGRGPGAVLTVAADDVADIMTRLTLGEIDLHDALGQVKALAVAEPSTPTPPPAEVPPAGDPAAGQTAGDAPTGGTSGAPPADPGASTEGAPDGTIDPDPAAIAAALEADTALLADVDQALGLVGLS